MGQGGVIRIVAALVAFDFNAGKAVLVNGETRHLDFIKIDLHRNRGETVRARALFFKAGDVVVGQVDDAAQCIQRLLHVIDFFRHHLQLIDGAVQRQRRAVTIVNNTAAGRNRDQLNAVFVGTRLVVVETDNLYVVEVGNQHAGKQQNARKSDQRAAYKQRGFSRIVAERIL